VLDWSIPARYARHIFFRRDNDIDVFIEDTASYAPKMYVELLSRLVVGIRLSSVFALGGRPEVIERCMQDQGARARPALYLIDSDAQALEDLPFISLKRLFVFRRYCVESYLCDEAAICGLCNDDCATLDAEAARAALDLDLWWAANAPPLARLALAFYIAYGVGVSFSVPSAGQIAQDGEGNVSLSKIDALVEPIAASVDAVLGAGAFEERVALILQSMGAKEIAARGVCGRRILAPLLLQRAVVRCAGFHFRKDSVFLRLARYCSVAELQGVSSAVA
jgi:hypothetical protein